MADEEHLEQEDRREASLRATTRGAALSAALILLSRVTGLGRDVAIAVVFGQGLHTDAYKAALQVPDLLFFLIAGGVLSSSFMPIYAEYRKDHGEDAAWELASVVLCWWTVFALVLVAVGELFAPALTHWLAVPSYGHPGSPWTPEAFALVVKLTRIVLPAQIAFFVGGVLMGIQWVHRDFLIPGIGPTFYNLGIMAGGVVGGLLLGTQGVVGLVWGGLVGALLGNLLLQLVGVLRYRPKLRLTLNWRHPGARRILLLMLPVIFSLSMPQVDVQITRWFANWLPAGSTSALDTAYRLMLLPVGVFGQGVATSFYATMTNLAAERRMDEFRTTLMLGLRQLAALAVPAAVLMMVLRESTVALLFQHGRFTAADTLLVAGALGFYALGIWFWCAEQLVGRAFYALKDTMTPPWCGTVVTVLFIGLAALLLRLFTGWWGPAAGHLGLALATSLAAALYAVSLLVLLRRKIGPLGLTGLVRTMARTLLASAGLGLAAWGCARGLAAAHWTWPPLVFLLASTAGAAAYALLARWLGLDEVAGVMGRLSARFASRFSKR